ncbi:hypothetical protein VNI00_007453 [Paramarasmius palmivorus]|uniref:C2H2-type domain-containing protein n=1 Tax=Paramarasmius palmivorus TaxID=297713 RepID=A0AAW0D4F6_9AGAR
MFLIDRHNRDGMDGPQSSDEEEKYQSYWPEGEKDFKNLPKPTHPPSAENENRYLYTTRNGVTTRETLPEDQHLLRPQLLYPPIPISLPQDSQTVTYGRSRKEFFLIDDRPDVPSQEDMEGYDSDFHTFFPRGQRYSSRSRSPSTSSSRSSSGSFSPKTFSLHPATFPECSSRPASPNQTAAGPSNAQPQTSTPSKSEHAESISREGSPPCSFTNGSDPSYNHFGIARSSFPHHYRDPQYYSTPSLTYPHVNDSNYVPPTNYSALAQAKRHPSPWSLSAKAQGKQRQYLPDTGYETGYESGVSGVPASELADLRLDGRSDLMDDTPSPDIPHTGDYPPNGMATSMSVFPANPKRPRTKTARSYTSSASPATRNIRARARSTTTSADNDDDDEGLLQHSRKGGGKRPAKRPVEETDDDWEPREVPPSKAGANGTYDTHGSRGSPKKRKLNRYPCPITGCKETFTRRNDVRRHVMNAAVHRDSEEAQRFIGETGTVTRCRLCNADLSRADARMRHERTSACGKRTTQKMKDQMIVMRV